MQQINKDYQASPADRIVIGDDKRGELGFTLIPEWMEDDDVQYLAENTYQTFSTHRISDWMRIQKSIMERIEEGVHTAWSFDDYEEHLDEEYPACEQCGGRNVYGYVGEGDEVSSCGQFADGDCQRLLCGACFDEADPCCNNHPNAEAPTYAPEKPELKALAWQHWSNEDVLIYGPEHEDQWGFLVECTVRALWVEFEDTWGDALEVQGLSRDLDMQEVVGSAVSGVKKPLSPSEYRARISKALLNEKGDA